MAFTINFNLSWLAQPAGSNFYYWICRKHKTEEKSYHDF